MNKYYKYILFLGDILIMGLSKGFAKRFFNNFKVVQKLTEKI